MPDNSLENLEGPIFVIGAAHSGKSEFAHTLMDHEQRAAVVGTADVSESFAAQRVAQLKSLRPNTWDTYEQANDVPTLVDAVLQQYNQILVDSLNQYIAAQIVEGSKHYSPDQIEALVEQHSESLLKQLCNSSHRVVIVSSELGASVSPPSALARLFRQTVGRVNRRFATEAKHVVQITAGIPNKIK